MRENHRLQRLFVEAPLAAGSAFAANADQFNYLANVLRLEAGDRVLVFNGTDGEWLAELDFPTRKKLLLRPLEQTRPQTAPSDLVYLFAPLKTGRMDYLVQKAVEMGAGELRPVLTRHVQGRAPATDKIRANAIEAAEQCGILSVPSIGEPVRLAELLDHWDGGRRILFCDEAAGSTNPLPILESLAGRRIALLVGPEGGFSDDERHRLLSLDFVTAIPLGPRILRADTAAVAALAVIQASLGDWR